MCFLCCVQAKRGYLVRTEADIPIRCGIVMQPVSILICSYAPIELIGKAGDRDQPLLPLSRFTTACHQLLDGLAALGNGDPPSASCSSGDIWSAVLRPSDGLAALGNGDPRAGLSGRSAAMLLWLTAMEDGKSAFTEADDPLTAPFASAGLADCGNGS